MFYGGKDVWIMWKNHMVLEIHEFWFPLLYVIFRQECTNSRNNIEFEQNFPFVPLSVSSNWSVSRNIKYIIQLVHRPKIVS